MKLEGKLDILSLIHGLRTLWGSASGLHISLAGLLGVAGFILTLRDRKIVDVNCLRWPSYSDSSLEKKWVVSGLQNLGNNCFLNVILQALASSSCFRSFLQKTMEECESLLGEEWADSSPLTIALASLMEDLSNFQHERMVLSPRKLMLVMSHYISNFNLANQQDAEEAFFHILSSLREEVSSYIPIRRSLVDVMAISNCKIFAPKSKVEQSEQERWRKSFFGPFDGILGSSLTCDSCSFQISLDFQFFHSLHLSPVLCGGANIIMPGCSLEDCLRKFFVVERLENYHCSHCWHGAAMKYLSSMDEVETDTGKLGLCHEQDSCDCKNLPCLKALPWSNNFSHTFKQLNIARSPKVLCIRLQRASVNEFGELVKLQGHVSFPLTLHLHPFVKKSGVVTKNWEENLQSFRPKQRYQHYTTNPFQLQLHTDMLNGIYVQNVKNIYSKQVIAEETRRNVFEVSDDKVGGTLHFPPPEVLNVYRLVSVVEHFGTPGNGHYTVYRRVRNQNNEDAIGLAGSPLVLWFCISDSQVQRVSEQQVLGAEASVLFYERIAEDVEICSQ